MINKMINEARYSILFNEESVRAILGGNKIQTRRVISIRNTDYWEDKSFNYNRDISSVIRNREEYWTFSLAYKVVGIQLTDAITIKCPYGKPGDLLWVRERLRRYNKLDFLGENKYTAQYVATDSAVPYAFGAREGWCGTALWEWKNKSLPSVFMPKWASRIILEVTEVRAEKLQKISLDDIKKEGFYGFLGSSYDEDLYIHQFANLWDSNNAKRGYSWGSNPWVWLIEFKPINF